MSVLDVETRPGWRRIVLNRPDRLNSFDEELRSALLAAVVDAGADSACRAVLLTGAGRAFCAGQDLEERNPNRDERIPSFREALAAFYNPLALAIRQMPKPVVCAVNGVAAGAGANLALSCDIVLAARSARFIQAFSNIGLTPDTGGSWYLPRLVGDARARALILLGLPVSASDAETWGMIWRVVDDNLLEQEAELITTVLASRPTRALANAKTLLDQSFSNTLSKQLDAEMESQDTLGATIDHAEGIRAFMGKRTPSFIGS
ncbi:MAG: enoyl-CoA hydratase-related protein [Janthinobacterium lividum]